MSEWTRRRRPNRAVPASGEAEARAATRGARLRARRGAITALVAILLLAVMGMLALAVDFGRLDNLKADLQTSADAGAHAGAIELLDTLGHLPVNAAAVATAYAQANPAMEAAVTVASVECGTWWDAGRSFTAATPPNTCNNSHNAVRVEVSRSSSVLFMASFISFVSGGTWTPPTLRAKAIASYVPDTCSTAWDTCRVYLVTEP